MVIRRIKERLLFGVTLAIMVMWLGRVGAEPNHLLYAPITSVAREGLYIYPENRAASIAFFHAYYTAPATSSIEWTGNHSQCNAGSVPPAFQAATVQRINY